MKKFLSGVITGLVTGLTIGYLTAPRSGKKTRRKITNAVDDQLSEAKGQWNKTLAKAEEAIASIKP